MSYLDMCFCPYSNTCEHGDVCVRALTESIKIEVNTRGLFIDIYTSKPLCHKEKQ